MRERWREKYLLGYVRVLDGTRILQNCHSHGKESGVVGSNRINNKFCRKIILLEGRQSIFLRIEIVYILRGSDYILHAKIK